MTVRVYNGQTSQNSQLVWRTRDGVRVLEPEHGWVNPQTICDYYKRLIPSARRSLMERLAQAEIEKSQEEDADELAYELTRLGDEPLTD
jgi:hypothetical protein